MLPQRRSHQGCRPAAVCLGLPQGGFDALSLGQRLAALRWLTDMVCDSPTIRMHLLSRDEQAQALKKLLRDEALVREAGAVCCVRSALAGQRAPIDLSMLSIHLRLDVWALYHPHPLACGHGSLTRGSLCVAPQSCSAYRAAALCIVPCARQA